MENEIKIKYLNRVKTMLDNGDSRSHVCSLINELEANKIIGPPLANSLADVLAADRSNAKPVLRTLIQTLERE